LFLLHSNTSLMLMIAS